MKPRYFKWVQEVDTQIIYRVEPKGEVSRYSPYTIGWIPSAWDCDNFIYHAEKNIKQFVEISEEDAILELI